MIRSTRTLILTAALVFATGVLIGILGYRSYSLQSSRQGPGEPPSPEQFRKMFVQEMTTRVKLSPDQVVKLERILDETRQKFNEMRKSQKPLEDAIRQEQVDKINAMLAPQQQQEYAQFRKERDERRKKEFRRPPSR